MSIPVDNSIGNSNISDAKTQILHILLEMENLQQSELVNPT
jgi:hypothetical protein